MKKLGLWDPLRKRGRPERGQPRTLVCDAAQNLKTVLSSFYVEEGGVKSLLPAHRACFSRSGRSFCESKQSWEESRGDE